MKKTSILILVMGLLLTACSAPAAADIAPEAVVETEAVQAPVVEEESEPILEAEAEIDLVVVDDQGNTDIDADALDSALTTLPTGELTALEVDGLAFMREEEKLARDVYLTLYEKWNMPVFQNIAGSESTHMDAVLTILERYGLEDPSAEKAVGEFTNPDLQALYDQLVDLGSQSLADALKVGAAIEEIDILDLEERMAQTEREDIIMVYQSLLKGSRNHLRSFTRTLQQQTGEVYAPQYMSQEAYSAIVSSGIETGGPGGSGGNGGNGGNGGGNGGGQSGKGGRRGKLFELSCNQNKILKCRSQDYRLLFCVKL